MEFIALPGEPGVFMSIWETRVRDFAAFVADSGYDATDRFYYYHNRSWKTGDRTWRNPGFEQTENHPVVGVSWRDAVAFCLWLTEKERNAGVIERDKSYRLPTDEEWSRATGESTANNLPYNFGNYHPELDVDTFEFTSPVGSFPPGAHGFYDMAGNVWEYCLDLHSDRDLFRVIRGGCWQNWHARFVGTDARGYCGQDVRITLYGFRVVLAGDDAKMLMMKTGARQVAKPPDTPLVW